MVSVSAFVKEGKGFGRAIFFTRCPERTAALVKKITNSLACLRAAD